MPSIYTHNRFGLQLLERLPKDMQDFLNKHRELYLLGQQGPDLFFFNPKTLMKSDSPGTVIHEARGAEYIWRQVKRLKGLPKDDPQVAYFIGGLCHYILDVHAHPTVNALVEPGDFSHIAIETELDRYFLEKDGEDALRFKLNKLILPADKTYAASVPDFYASYKKADKATVMWGIRFFRYIKRFFYATNPLKEKFLLMLVKLIGDDPNYRGLIMRLTPLKQASHSNSLLEECYEKGLNRAYSLIQEALNHVYLDQELSDFFDHDYNGVKHHED